MGDGVGCTGSLTDVSGKLAVVTWLGVRRGGRVDYRGRSQSPARDSPNSHAPVARQVPPPLLLLRATANVGRGGHKTPGISKAGPRPAPSKSQQEPRRSLKGVEQQEEALKASPCPASPCPPLTWQPRPLHVQLGNRRQQGGCPL